MPTLLRVHSWYSFLRGLASPKALAEAAARAGYTAVLLADHHGLTGALEFQDACDELGLQPLLGLELHLERDSQRSSLPDSVSLVAMDEVGWANLCQLSSSAQIRPDRDLEHGVALAEVCARSTQVLCLLDGESVVARPGNGWLEALRAAFGDRLVVVVNRNGSEAGAEALAVADASGLAAMAGHRVYYLEPDDAELQRTVTGIRVNRPRDVVGEAHLAPPDAFLPSAAELWDRFADLDGLSDADDLAARCSLRIPHGRHLFPALDLPAGETPEKALRRAAEAGALRLYGAEGALPAAVQGRLDHELAIIDAKGFAPIFLVMQEVIAFARRDGVPSASRGSASSSLVAHCLDITTPDPLALNLYFERFLNPARATPPDIDTDLCSRRRDRVIAHVFEHYGSDRVAMVATINCLQERSALREAAKAFEIDADELVDEVPSRGFGPRATRARNGGPYDALKRRSNAPRFRQMLDHAEALIGQPDHLSIHPGGIVIAPRPIRDLCPVHLASKGITITQFDLDGIERLGLIKLDLLGIRGLTVVADVAEGLLAQGQIPAASGPPPRHSVSPSNEAQASPGMPQASPGMPQASPGMPQASPGMPQASPGMPQASPGMPQASPGMPQASPGMPQASPGMPQASPGMPQASPGMPQASPGMPQASPVIRMLDAIPITDEATSELIRSGRTIGCFQIESGGMRNTLRDLQARSIDDVLAALALFRPGPIQGGLRDAYVRRHLGREPVEHIHPALAPVLAETLGVILYQEQVLRVAHELAGLSLADADLLRRAMSHFDPGEKMRTLRERFVAGAEQVSGIAPEVGARIWEMMAAFAGYGFPKAHAASYAVAAWRSAWCKTHHPALFMAAVLANWGGYYSQRVYLTEARRLGLSLRPPHVNHSRHEFSVVQQDGRAVLYMGLDQVRDLTQRTIAAIERGRPFTSLDDFLTRVDPRPGEAANLAQVDAFAGLVSPQHALERLAGGWSAGQPGLFDSSHAGEEDLRSLAERVAAEEVVLGAAVSAHPLELAAGRYGEALTTVQAAAHLGQTIRVAAMRQTWRRSRNAEGARVYYMVAEDLEGMVDCMISSTVYERHRAIFAKGPGPFVLEGGVESNAETGEAELHVRRVEPIPMPDDSATGRSASDD